MPNGKVELGSAVGSRGFRANPQVCSAVDDCENGWKAHHHGTEGLKRTTHDYPSSLHDAPAYRTQGTSTTRRQRFLALPYGNKCAFPDQFPEPASEYDHNIVGMQKDCSYAVLIHSLGMGEKWNPDPDLNRRPHSYQLSHSMRCGTSPFSLWKRGSRIERNGAKNEVRFSTRSPRHNRSHRSNLTTNDASLASAMLREAALPPMVPRRNPPQFSAVRKGEGTRDNTTAPRRDVSPQPLPLAHFRGGQIGKRSTEMGNSSGTVWVLRSPVHKGVARGCVPFTVSYFVCPD